MLADITWLITAAVIILAGVSALAATAVVIAATLLVRVAIRVLRRTVPVIDGDHSDVPQLAAAQMRRSLTAAADTELQAQVKR